MIQLTSIQTQDQVNLQLETVGGDNAIALIINPAIGVKRAMYRSFATYLAENGITTVIYNYRGMEDGMLDLPKEIKTDVEAWGCLDQSAVINWVNTELKPEKQLILGHSIGGQLVGFADNFEHINGVIHVASQKGDYRLWPFMGRLQLMLLWHVLIPLMSRNKTFNAKKLGLGSYHWPAAAAAQWASWGREHGYFFHPKFGFDLRPWHNFNKPLLSFGFTDDAMAPPAAIEGLLEEFGKNNDNQPIDKCIIKPDDIGVKSMGHFGFFKPPAKPLWQDLIKWIKNQ